MQLISNVKHSTMKCKAVFTPSVSVDAEKEASVSAPTLASKFKCVLN